MSTLTTSTQPKDWDPWSGHSSSDGVWFDVQSEGPSLRITAILAACYGAFGSGSEVVVHALEEGSGVGKERERGAWPQVAAGTLQDYTKGSTRLVLSSPVSVRAGARAGLLRASTSNRGRHRRWCCLCCLWRCLCLCLCFCCPCLWLCCCCLC